MLDKNRPHKRETIMAGYAEKIESIAIWIMEIVCAMFPLDEWELEETAEEKRVMSDVSAMVRFQGAADGVMIFRPCRQLLESLAVNMLGTFEASQEVQEGALCEVANIICGNTVPLFALHDTICTLQPPRIVRTDELDVADDGMDRESVSLFFDEGLMEMTIYYSREVSS